MTRYAPPPPRLATWRMSNGRRVGAFRVFDVTQHDVHDAAGKPRGDVYTFDAPTWCNVIAVTDADELVMVWQYRFGVDRLGLEVPGGVIERGESPEIGARRELLEETGYAAASFELISTVEPNPALQGNVCHAYLARGAHLAGETSFDPLEELEVVLVPARHIADLIDGGYVTHALVVAALERYRRMRNAG